MHGYRLKLEEDDRRCDPEDVAQDFASVKTQEEKKAELSGSGFMDKISPRGLFGFGK